MLGRHLISRYHRDSEKQNDPAAPIASISLGACRTFQMRRYKTHEDRVDVELESGSLLVMWPDSNGLHEYEHGLPKRTKGNSGRINITFRRIKYPQKSTSFTSEMKFNSAEN
jgi:alkylated DNA repair dioxygenase AlkB